MRMLALLPLLWLAGCQTAAEPAAPQVDDTATTASISDAAAFAMARKAVVSKLRDPQSAQFGPMQRRTARGSEYVCGTINAKNGFGGYSGQKIFAYRISKDFVVNEEDRALGFIAVETCR